MNVAIALTAAQKGATVVNHCEVETLTTNGVAGESGYAVTGAVVRDTITGKSIAVKATAVINACGVCVNPSRRENKQTHLSNICVIA